MAWTNTGGGDHEGANWTPASGTAISGTHTNIGEFTVTSGYTVYVASASATRMTTFAELHIYAYIITVDGTIQGNERGYAGGPQGSNGSGPGFGYGGENNAGGAGYGGHGGNSNYAGGIAYGTSNTVLIQRGSGGGGGPAGSGDARSGGNGGGCVGLYAWSINVSGIITCNGQYGKCSTSWCGAGGSGGGILLHASNIDVSGSLIANGNGLGAGGRIKIFGWFIYTTGATITAVKGAAGPGEEDGTTYSGQLDALGTISSSIIIF